MRESGSGFSRFWRVMISSFLVWFLASVVLEAEATLPHADVAAPTGGFSRVVARVEVG